MSIVIQELAQSFGGRELFRDFSLEIPAGVRLCVVGANGTGKSTLLKIIAGRVSPYAGRVIMPKTVRLGYVAQELSDEDLQKPLLNFVLEVLPSWGDFWQEWEDAHALGDESAVSRLTKRQAELEHLYGYSPEQRGHEVLSGLSFAVEDHMKPLGEFSGGWRERAKLARVLTAGADVLLLDEPTNHLDLEAVEWLENFLVGYAGALILVAHDRVFLERVGTHVLYLGGKKPVYRKGSFEEFLVWQEEVEEQRERAEKKIQSDLEKKLDFVRRFGAKATKARQAQSRKKQAQKLAKELEGFRPESKRKTLSFSWPEPKRGDKTPIAAADLRFHFPDKPELWEPLTFQIFQGQRIALAGPNGMGKSTLLKLIVGELTPLSGRVERGSNTVVGWYSQHQLEILNAEKTVLSEIRRLSDPKLTEEELMSVLGLFMLGESYFDRFVHELSGGEKARLLLATLFLKGANLLVLDEPTNHLDLESREALVEALAGYTGTLLVVAHDRRLMSECTDTVWALSPDGIELFQGGFDDYEAARKAKLDQSAKRAKIEARAPLREDRESEKRRKREEAQARNELAKKHKPLKDAQAKAESGLAQALDRQTVVEGLLADPAVFSDMAQSTALLKEYEELKVRAEQLFEKLARIEADLAALADG